jgi:hypothetical protein
VQNQPDPDTPVHKRRWLDRLRAAWEEVRRSPKDKAKAGALEEVAQERPGEASYRIDTFAADSARRAGSTPAEPEEEPAERVREKSERPRKEATPESDRFDDEAGQ